MEKSYYNEKEQRTYRMKLAANGIAGRVDIERTGKGGWQSVLPCASWEDAARYGFSSYDFKFLTK
jgi:hypothetical protein